MPFLDNSFDKIIFTDVLEHVKDDLGTLREIVRIGRPGSLVALVTPGVRGRLAGTGWRKLYHDEEGTPEYDERAGYEPEELRQLMEEAGIRVSEVRQTLIFAAEFFLQFTKWFLSKRKVHYQTQADILDITQSRSFRLYRRFVFPLFYGIGRLEEALLGGRMDGHSLIALGIVDKPAVSTRPQQSQFAAVNG
jgi:SAM-dependent methyltransferase